MRKSFHATRPGFHWDAEHRQMRKAMVRASRTFGARSAIMIQDLLRLPARVLLFDIGRLVPSIHACRVELCAAAARLSTSMHWTPCERPNAGIFLQMTSQICSRSQIYTGSLMRARPGWLMRPASRQALKHI